MEKVFDYSGKELDLWDDLHRSRFNAALARHYAGLYRVRQFWCGLASLGLGLGAIAFPGTVAMAFVPLVLAFHYGNEIRRCGEMAEDYARLSRIQGDAWGAVQAGDGRWQGVYQAARDLDVELASRYVGFPPFDHRLFCEVCDKLDAAGGADHKILE